MDDGHAGHEESIGEAARTAVSAFEETLRSVVDASPRSSKLFPYGITKIAVTVSGASVSVEVEGPQQGGALLADGEDAKGGARLRAVKFSTLWSKHPYPDDPCAQKHENQCAIRMTVAFEKAGIDTASFDQMYKNRRCWEPGHKPGHILAAEEFARWLDAEQILGRTSKRKKVTSDDYKGKTGVVAFLNMPAANNKTIDHIDLWNRDKLKAGDSAYFDQAEEVWFWDVA